VPSITISTARCFRNRSMDTASLKDNARRFREP
jgi:hypothetical protein